MYHNMFKNITKFNMIKIKRVPVNRSFLSEAYRCTEAWNARLSTPILQKVDIDSIYYELDHKFQHKRKVSAIDIDVFANRLDNDGYSEELADLLNRFRVTEQINYTLESTGHAVIRHYFEHDQIQQLVSILNDRINYGVFLDTFTVNIALDKLIKNKDFKSAAKFATIFMLEEDFSHLLTKYLCLYSCYQYIKTTELLREKIDPIPIKKEKQEEIKVRVKYLRNEYFDDHFDLSDLNHLTGKTLIMIADTENSNETLQNSLRLIGYCLYEKYGKAIEILDNVRNQNYYKDIIVMITKILEEYKDRETDDNYKKLMETIKILQTSTNLKTDNFEEFICKLTNEAVVKYEPIDIENQKKIYQDWCTIRAKKLNEELERLKRAQRLSNIEQVTKDMVTEEQKLWFFENEDKLDLQIESKIVRYPKRWFGKKKKPRVIDENYIPPEV